MADFNHTDYTDELNRIIVALTGIRDDIRLIRTLQEDCEAGLVTNSVMNDFERALFAVSMSAASGGDAEAVRNAVSGGAGSGTNGGYGAPAGSVTTPLNQEREEILTALGQDTETTKTLIRVNGIYYFEPEPTAGPDDGLRGSIPQVEPYTQGELLGFDNEATGAITQGAPSGPPNSVPDPTARNKRWIAPRPAGQTALPVADPNADIVNPVTGEVVPRSIDDIRAGITRGDAPPPAIDPDAEGAQ